ncbi:MAG: hypothetical protein FJ387_06415 [Verrucomicrobia bacterium]|nr:hypothetical protein [Verrucomicrobiota bacterium]
MSHPTALVQKSWNYCNTLRDHGLSYGDYVEQLTFLLFLKMAGEQSGPLFSKPSPIPKGKDWPALLANTSRRARSSPPSWMRSDSHLAIRQRARWPAPSSRSGRLFPLRARPPGGSRARQSSPPAQKPVPPARPAQASRAPTRWLPPSLGCSCC